MSASSAFGSTRSKSIMKLDGNGKVGIGTTAPLDQLEVVNGNRKVGLNTVIPGVTNGGVVSVSRGDDGAKLLLMGASASPTDDAVIYGSGGVMEMRMVQGGGTS